MLITPDSTIKVYSNIPLDNTYEHSLYFESISAQNSYFHSSGHVKYSFQSNTYQRVNRNRLRVNVSVGNLYNCNYLAFQNSGFGNKWFYAFITAVEYVNNVTSEIEFEIDVMQTYLFDITRKECFVEREHTYGDAIGDYLEPEPISVGEYVYEDFDTVKGVSDICVCILTSDSGVNVTKIDSVLCGGRLKIFRTDDISSINSYLENYLDDPSAVIAMYMCPTFLFNLKLEIADGGQYISTNFSSNGYSQQSLPKFGKKFGDYMPRNNKVYTYPYNFMKIDNYSGQSLNLRYEFFDDLIPKVNIEGTVNMPVQLVLRPTKYKGLTGTVPSSSESLTLDCYPQCSWNVDSYNAWVAQNAVPIAINTGATILSTGGSIAGGLATGVAGAKLASGAFSTGVGAVANILTQQYQASIRADECRGNINSGNVNVANHTQNFYRMRARVNDSNIRVIDDFFTRYGYAVNRVKQPTFNNRRHYTYVKTVGACCTGACPADDIRKFCSILDNGITMWRNANEVGNYDVDNTAYSYTIGE